MYASVDQTRYSSVCVSYDHVFDSSWQQCGSWVTEATRRI